ncbi:LacI family DNA-binding transcriptional regulator [Paenibacillus taichungensis]|uniref:LacI family DNA-binding transcriptional regulator n=1 Tax=Paenibacillus TaxID=44249 RepID=UPI00096E2972|nr:MULTISPECIES: LacI family DNA-binding transcriptional regulator [Paenibacillus]OME83252.1 transcriptional regulator [Paenibacillus pabuli]MDR9745592.1 LacI family DNA-binding transcriptional regulator [Paenibacillus taichungensis]MEC0105935.1 LacI family DNA-binding transcriptional regulator [Paenibacillus taichungensis]MEC0196624.1 LacI family DNA-binding transcriptional regulator [Paenibacillus taichungensis]PIH60699.1 LacI family transcriptional regulator [Paenibacillus sp. LK1]
MSKFDEIMKLSGYSKATVSRVINHSPHVSDEARQKITQIMKQLNYIPNRNAVSLSTGQTKQIGIVTSATNEIILTFMNQFIDTAMDYGFQTLIYTSRGDKEIELQAFEDLRSKRVDGLVIMTCVNPPDKLKAYCEYGPIVSWQRMGDDEIPSVAMDQAQGYKLALEHLVSKGYSRIANAFGRAESLNTQSRREAYESFMTDKGLPVLREAYQYSVFSSSDGEEAMRRMANGPELPQAVLCSNDYAAIGIWSEARKQNIQVPEQLAIVGFDDIELSRVLGITTIHNPIAEQATQAFHRLWAVLGKQELQPQQLEFQLIERATT